MSVDRSLNASVHLSPFYSWIVATPSDEKGVIAACASPCEHKDCARFHRIAKKPCRWCGEEIGYNNLYLIEDDEKDVLIHTDCWMEANPNWG